MERKISIGDTYSLTVLRILDFNGREFGVLQEPTEFELYAVIITPEGRIGTLSKALAR